MRLYSFSILSTLFLGLAACPQGGAEDCSDNADNDGDATVDCDDSECATDPACDEEEETDVEETGPEICDDEEGDDEDDDGDANCGDSDCAGISENCDELQGFFMIIDGTTTDTTSFAGKGTSGWERYELDATSYLEPKQADCHIDFDVTGAAHEAAADCTNCEFAFRMAFANSTEQNGLECDEPYNDLHDADGNAYTLDGAEYGFGYDPTYTYEDTVYPRVMFYSETNAEWGAASFDVARTETGFTFALQLSEYLYYY